MVLGILQFELLIHGSESLKDKRRVVKSVKDRLHREHLVSVAEVAGHESLTVATMAIALVGTDGGRVGVVLDHILDKLRALADAELGATDRHIIQGTQLDMLPHASETEVDPEGLARELLDYYDSGDHRQHGD